MRRFLPAPAGARPPHRQQRLQRHALREQPSRSARRRGMTLLEVIIALAIFLLSLVGINNLVDLSTKQASKVLLQGQAIQLAQSKMAEIYAGVVPLSSQSDVPFDEDNTWHFSADCEQAQVTNLWTVTVHVSKKTDAGQIEVTLTQMMLDPSVRGTTVNLNSAATTGSTSSSSMGGS